MTPHEICHSSNQPLIITAVVLLVAGGILSLWLWRRGAPGARAAILFAICVAIAGGFLGSILRADPSFMSYRVGDGSLVLGFAWPKSDVTLALAQLKEIRVEHGVIRQHQRASAIRSKDTVWITLLAGSDSYASCHAAAPESLVAAAKDIAAAARITPGWYLRCEDGHTLPTTDDDVGRGGDRWDAELAPRCAAK